MNNSLVIAKEKIEEHLNRNCPVPILLIVDENTKSVLENDFRKELEEFQAIDERDLFLKGRSQGYKVFKFCTPTEYTNLNEMIICNTNQYSLI